MTKKLPLHMRILNFVNTHYSAGMEFNSTRIAHQMGIDLNGVSGAMRRLDREGLIQSIRQEVGQKRWRYVYTVVAQNTVHSVNAPDLAALKAYFIKTLSTSELVDELKKRVA